MPPARPLFRDVHHRRIQHFQQRIVGRKNSLGFGHFPKSEVGVLNGVGEPGQTIHTGEWIASGNTTEYTPSSGRCYHSFTTGISCPSLDSPRCPKPTTRRYTVCAPQCPTCSSLWRTWTESSPQCHRKAGLMLLRRLWLERSLPVTVYRQLHLYEAGAHCFFTVSVSLFPRSVQYLMYLPEDLALTEVLNRGILQLHRKAIISRGGAVR